MVSLCLFDLLIQGRHLLTAFQAVHFYRVSSLPCGCAGHIHSYVAAAHYHYISGEGTAASQVYFAQEFHTGYHTGSVLPFHVQPASALGADCYVKCLVALFSQFIQRHIFSHFHAGLKFHTHLFQHINLCIQHIFFQAEGGDSKCQHTAQLFLFFKNSHPVIINGKVIRTGKSCRAAADNGDLIAQMVAFRRNIAHITVQFLIRDKFLDLINGDRLVNIPAGAFILTAVRADAAADSRERIFLFDQFQGLFVFSSGSQLDIALYRNMGRTGGFTGGSSLLRHILTVLPVVHIPILFAPHMVPGRRFLCLWKRLFGTESLPQLQGICGTVFHALSAGHTLLRVHLRGKIGADGIRCAEQRCDTHGETGTAAAVADRR